MKVGIYQQTNGKRSFDNCLQFNKFCDLDTEMKCQLNMSFLIIDETNSFAHPWIKLCGHEYPEWVDQQT